MNYCIDPTVSEPIMLLNKHIGFDEEDGMGIDGSIFQQELLQLDTLGKKRIQVWINSPGGVVTDGYNIYSAILKSNTPVDTYCIGAAASIAGVIFQAGRKRIMSDYGWLMYHNPFGGTDGILKTMQASIIKMIEQRCGMSEDEVSRMMARTTFIAAGEALNMNLCDKVDASVDENTKYLRKITDTMTFHKECNLVLNSILNNNPKISNTMIKVCMKLGLNDGTPEESIVQAIDSIMNKVTLAEQAKDAAIQEAQNKAKTADEEFEKLKNKFKKLEEEKKAKDEAYDACKASLDAMTEDKLKAENAMKEEEAKNMVTNFAKLGRIKNEATVILKWTNMAKVDFEGTKLMIEDLPLNKVATKAVDAEAQKLGAGEIPTSSIGLAVKNRLKREGKI